MNPQPDCDLIRRWISLSRDQELVPGWQERVDDHLDHCSDCRLWHEDLDSGLSDFDQGFDDVVGEIEQLLKGHLSADQLDNDSEPVEVVKAADRAAPRLVAVVTLLLLSIGLISWWLLPQGGSLLAIRSAGPITIIELGEQEITLRPSMADVPVKVGETITCSDGVATLIDPAGRTMTMNAESTLEVESSHSINLKRGVVRFEVTPAGKNFLVSTPEVAVLVTGTAFEVERWPARFRTEVRILEGEVEVTRDSNIALPLGAGEKVEVARNGGWMFHAARPLEEGQAPLPAARLGTPAGIDRAPFPVDEEPEPQPDRSPNTPLDLPRQHNEDDGDEPDEQEPGEGR